MNSLNKSIIEMKKILMIATLMVAGAMTLSAGLKPGDKAKAFNLKNVDGSMVSLADYDDTKGVILIFTCNECPYAKAYEDRIIALHEKYAEKGYPVVAVNPNDDEISKGDTYTAMKQRAADKEYPFPYLKDETQEVYKSYGATRTPHIYLLENKGGVFKVAYVGTIDDSAMDASSVSETFLEDALSALMKGKAPDPAETKAVGCSIKAKK